MPWFFKWLWTGYKDSEYMWIVSSAKKDYTFTLIAKTDIFSKSLTSIYQRNPLSGKVAKEFRKLAQSHMLLSAILNLVFSLFAGKTNRVNYLMRYVVHENGIIHTL